MDTSERRGQLRERLIEAAERTLSRDGLAALKARDLAREVGCALGAIYTVFSDLDGLILAVNMRTLALFEGAIAASSGATSEAVDERDAAIDDLVRLALAYLAFAEQHGQRWRALFQHRIESGDVPDWYRAEQGRLFRYIEAPLARLCPSLTEAERSLRARSLFSSTHGVVSLGLDEKLVVLPAATLARELETLVRALGRGLADEGKRGES
ncbi:MAG TPA: TetR/AcrR family transcriptional regulator [Beijerinckiaceae bacterium]|jgi:AcrR family transcriptional regulator